MHSLLAQYELSKVFNGRVNGFSPSILKWRSGTGRSRLRRIVSSTTVFLTYFKHGCVNRLSCPLFGYSASSIVISNYRGLLVWRNTLSTIIFAFMRGYSMHRTTACGRKQPVVVEPESPRLFAGDFVKRLWIDAANQRYCRVESAAHPLIPYLLWIIVFGIYKNNAGVIDFYCHE